MNELRIPDFPDDVDVLTAALAYADAGWYVLPVAAGTKKPGTVVGKDWHMKSSRDPKQITAWFAGADHGIALHCGRSGAVIFDVDKPDNVPPDLAEYLKSAPYQSTRPDQPGRGHSAFLMPAGRILGNGLGKLSNGWGEIRGANGVIVVEPTKHPEGGEYRWKKVGPVPALPDELADKLPDASPASDAVTDARLRAFIDEHASAERPELLDKVVDKLVANIAGGESRHNSAVSAVAWAMTEAAAGFYAAKLAIDRLWRVFKQAVLQDGSRSESVARSEFWSIVSWGVGQALAQDLDMVRADIEWRYPRIGSAVELDDDDEAVEGGLDSDEIEDFWTSRPVLQHIRQYARARGAGPWGALGSTLARAIAVIPPRITLPPTVGGRMSLNLIVALVGPSGLGKNASDSVAKEAIRFKYAGVLKTPPELPIGTGEGIARTFQPPVKRKDEDEDAEPLIEAIFTAAEIDTLSVLSNRQGATLDGELRKLYSGETLGFTNSSKETRTKVQAHSYRACLIVGAQPLRCATLLDASDGGTPQRFLWLKVDDPNAPEVDLLPPTPGPLTIEIPEQGDEYLADADLKIPEAVRIEILRHRRAMLRGESVDPFHGHRLLSRLKVAAALMVLDSNTPGRERGTVTAEDWDLAGTVMDMSDLVRAGVQQEAQERARSINRNRAMAAAERAVIQAERLDQSAEERCKRAILSKLAREGSLKGPALRRACKASIRDSFDSALEALMTSGDVVQIVRGDGHADEYEIA
ncbi:bifunctional DNA primase/polymerase [Mycolicibacterium septicum]|uniref:bifunctional DNA primase/polymerase n=1 Tax=Mycolicibacterium septicum TaxID=98668 RepID=UPI001AF0EA4F|nr:bifunctional DNA primase/polymerase [Mycolicibacterium septicum]QRY53382.1 bifunctional DNA primase/polymerase [Mycolicibacterium septicum]